METSGLYQLQSRAEERLNSATHGFGLFLSLLGFALLFTASLEQSFGVRLVALIYGLSLVQLFAASTFYHSCTNVALKVRARTLDHCSIYVLIAGSYTPFMALAINDWKGWSLLALVWGLAIFGVYYKCFAVSPYGFLSVFLYLVMGWLVVLVWTPLAVSIGSGGLAWLIAGGLFYTIGVPFYAWTSLRFGHGIWHLFVLAGAVCHYVAVLKYVVG